MLIFRCSSFRNALNIVKDDLIAKVDELSSEQEILRDEIRSLQSMRNRLRLRTDELEAEVKTLREEIENARKAAKSEEEVIFKIRNVLEPTWLNSIDLNNFRRMYRCLSENVSRALKWLVFSWSVTSTKNGGWNYRKR